MNGCRPEDFSAQAENLFLPDPITNFDRARHLQRRDRRQHYIVNHSPGFNLRYWQRIIRAPARIEHIGRCRHWSLPHIRLTQALLISRMACIFIDHLVARLIEADIIPVIQQHEEWEKQYRRFIAQFLQAESIPERLDIVEIMVKLHHYTSPPPSLLHARRRHWTLLKNIYPKLAHPSKPAEVLIDHYLHSSLSPTVIARKICLMASLHADYQEQRHCQTWRYAYSDCMLRLYDTVKASAPVLTAIIELE